MTLVWHSCVTSHAAAVTCPCFWGRVGVLCLCSPAEKSTLVCCNAGCMSAPPPAPANSAWPADGCQAAVNGTACVATCLGDMVGSPYVMCNAAGNATFKWGEVVGSCAPPAPAGCTGQLPAPPAGAIWPAADCNNTANGGLCWANCTGINGTVLNPPYSMCSEGTWGPVSGSCTVQAAPAECTGTLPPPPANSEWSECNGTTAGQSCAAICAAGMVGSPSVACRSSGESSAEWGDVTGSCQALTASPGGWLGHSSQCLSSAAAQHHQHTCTACQSITAHL